MLLPVRCTGMGARKRGGRDLLTRPAIVDRALAIADAEGADSVTIRRLARELSLTPMALYWHFTDKDDLLDALADRLIAEIDPTVDETAPWQRQFGALLEAHLAVLRAHPAASALLWKRNNASDAALRVTEVALDALRRAGFSPVEATHVARNALRMLTALVEARPFVSAGSGRDDSTRRFLESLPADRFPRIIEAAAPLSECDTSGAHDRLGLKFVLAGVEALAGRRRVASVGSDPPAVPSAP